MRYEGQNLFSVFGSTSKLSYYPGIVVGFDFFGNENVRKTVYRIDLRLNYDSPQIFTKSLKDQGSPVYWDGSPYQVRHEIKQISLVLTPQVLYNLYNKQSLKWFGGLGISGSYTQYLKSDFIELYNSRSDVRKIKMDPMSAGVQICTGVTLFNKVQGIFSFSPLSSRNEFGNFAIRQRKNFVSINYLFK
jgi:hypothetical protein